MLKELIQGDLQKKNDYNCAEAILYGANEAYGLGLDKNALKLSSAFGGGMGVQKACGALTGSLMVIGNLFTEEVQHQSPKVKVLREKFIREFEEATGHLDCSELKDKYWDEDHACKSLVMIAAEIMDRLYWEEVKA